MATKKKAKKVGYRRRRKVGKIDTGTILLIGGGAAVLLYLFTKPSTPSTTIIRTSSPTSSSAATTAAEITAGASVANALINDLTPC